VAQPPKLSVRLHGGLAPRRCVELAKAAEAGGFHTVWFAENAFHRGVLPAAAACAAATTRIGIGIGVFNPYNRHPTLMAMEIGALDELAQGRVRLGIGSGIAAATRRLGLDPDRPLAAVRDAIAIVRAMLAGEAVNYRGRLFSASDVKLEYRALRPDLALLMAARGDRALALCGEIADGLMISNMCPPEFTRHAVEVMQRSAREAGRGAPAEVVQYIPCVARPERGEADRCAKEVVGRLLADYWSLGQRVASARSALLRARGLSESDFVAAVEGLRRGKSPGEMLDERFVAAFAIAGTAEDCLARTHSYREAGATELVLTFTGPEPERDMQYLGAALQSCTVG
jgi:5,10-methylenetetrahydromethanopterin reductase